MLSAAKKARRRFLRPAQNRRKRRSGSLPKHAGPRMSRIGTTRAMQECARRVLRVPSGPGWCVCCKPFDFSSGMFAWRVRLDIIDVGFLNDSCSLGEGRHRSADNGSNFVEDPQVLPRGTPSGNAHARRLWSLPRQNGELLCRARARKSTFHRTLSLKCGSFSPVAEPEKIGQGGAGTVANRKEKESRTWRERECGEKFTCLLFFLTAPSLWTCWKEATDDYLPDLHGLDIFC